MHTTLTVRCFIAGILSAFTLCCAAPAAAFSILEALGDFDTRLGEFNPLGHYVVDPINKAVPRLHINGFLQLDTAFNVHGDDHSIGAGKIDKDWRAQKIEWLMELEASYKLSDNVEFVAVTHFLYDSAYDWQHSRGLFADSTDRSSHYYHRGEEILRELYVKCFLGNFDIYLGKQQVVWGKMEGRVADIVNPQDRREYPPADWQDDYEFRRIPLWMANVTYNWENSSLQLLWIPDFEEDHGPTFGTAYFPPFIEVPSVAKFTPTDKPSSSLRDNEWGARFNTMRGSWEFSLLYFYTWSDSPTNFRRRFRTTSLKNGLVKLEVEPKHTRWHQFGAVAETSFYALGHDWVVSNELLYTLNKYYIVDDESLLPGSLEDGVKKRDEIFFGSRWMTAFFGGELNFILQPLVRYIVGYNHHLSSPGTNQKIMYGTLLVLSKSYESTGDRLNTTYRMVGFLNSHPSSRQEGWRHLFEVRWKVSDYIKTMLYYEWYDGDSRGIYGAYDKYDNLGFYIKYEF